MILNLATSTTDGGGVNLTDRDPTRRAARLRACTSAEEIAELYALSPRHQPAAGRPGSLTRDLAGNILPRDEMSARLAWARWSEGYEQQLTQQMIALAETGHITDGWSSAQPLPVRADRPKFDRTVQVLPDGRERRMIGPKSSITAPAGSSTGKTQRRPAAPARPTAGQLSPAARKARSDALKAKYASRRQSPTPRALTAAERHRRSEQAKARIRAKLTNDRRAAPRAHDTASLEQRIAAIKARHRARQQAQAAAMRRMLSTGGVYVLR